MANKTRYLSQQEKETAKVMYANGSTVFQVSLTLNRSHHAIKRVVTRPEVQAEIENIRERLIDKYQTLAENCLDRLLDEGAIDKASPRDLATISGISVDKARQLSELKNIATVAEKRPSIGMDDRTRTLFQAALDRYAKADAIDVTPESDKALITQGCPPKEDKC
jgi:hypothetical protein